jgi:hypothetical protein
MLEVFDNTGEVSADDIGDASAGITEKTEECIDENGNLGSKLALYLLEGMKESRK